MGGDLTNMTTVPSIVQALESLGTRNRFHEKVMLGMATILALSGVVLLIFASLTEGTDRVVTLVGGTLFVALTFLPYNQIRNLRKHNLAIGMILTATDHLQREVAPDTLQQLTRELLRYSLRY
jgi:hypothetical protein